MALPGKASTAHEFDNDGQCIHCRMYKSVVDELSHVCTKERELATDGVWLNRGVPSQIT